MSRAVVVKTILIKHQRIAEALILDAVAVPASASETQAHLFCQGAVKPEQLLKPGAQPNLDIKSLGDHQILRCPVDQLAKQIKISAPQIDLFRGQNTILGFRNGQSPAVSADWLNWHAHHHNLEAALIVDRTQPGEDPGFAKQLSDAAQSIEGLKTLVILRFDYPLGDPDLPAEAHPYCAADAPGKDRMEVPAGDPWSSPLGQLNVIELLRRRFLAQARAVAFLDISDLAAPGPEADLFNAATQSSSGFCRLEGIKAYPWRVRSDQAAHFSDHICQQFDNTNPVTRWSVAPAVAAPSRLWRPFYVPASLTDDQEAQRFYRHMGLRHDPDPVSQIVPKSSLIENPELIAIAKSHWQAKPVPVPHQKLRSASATEGSDTVTIVTCMKNEGPFILEWLAYHRMIGVTNILVYSNDCSDGTDEFLQLLQSKGLLQHRDNPFRETGLKPQHAALMAADDEPVVKSSDWLISMDVDEFINIKAGEGKLADLFQATQGANMISMTWRLFGNAGINDFADQPILQNFTRCAPHLTRKPHQAWGFKTLYRNLGIFKKMGVHRPKGLNPQLWEDIRWVNGSGKPMPKSAFRNAWRSTLNTVGYDLVSLNHYALRSAESFLVKRDRGRVNHVDRDQGLAYWFRMNHNLQEDRSIQRLLPALEAELAKLKSDPEIAAQHARCVQAHRTKITELLKSDANQAFFKTLTSARMQRLSHLLPHFGANVFLAGPDCVPNEIVFKDHSASFFFTVERQKTQH